MNEQQKNLNKCQKCKYPVNIIFEIFGFYEIDNVETKREFAEHISSQKELNECLNEIYKSLTFNERKVVKMFYIENKTIKEIAESLKEDSKNIVENLNISLKKLRHPMNTKKLKSFLPTFDNNGNIIVK